MQFTLRTIMLLFVVVWSSLAAFGVWGALGVLFLLFLLRLDYLYRSANTRKIAVRLMIPVMLGGYLIVLLFSIFSSYRVPGGDRARLRCYHNLEYLAIALREYHADHGCFPPAYVADAEGKPMHSWRVLILPYLEGQHLYEQYDFDEPWNGPNNGKLAGAIPGYFQCPDLAATTTSMTASYLAVVGPNAVWPGTTPRKVGEISDGRKDTIMLVEVANSGINWMQPQDISPTKAMAGIRSTSALDAAPLHTLHDDLIRVDRAGGHVATADGRVHFLGGDIPSEALECLLTVNDGEAFDIRDFDPVQRREIGRRKQMRYRYFAFVAVAISLILLLFQLQSGAGGKR